MKLEIKYYTHGVRNKSQIALSFDDGPNSFVTEQVLSILNQFGIKANFFVLGELIQKYPRIIKEIQLQGHLLGVHGYSHLRKEDPDFVSAAKLLAVITGEKPIFFRPPYGDLSVVSKEIFSYQRKAKVVLFDVDARDWRIPSPISLQRRIEKKIKKGSIIDLHDGSQHPEERTVRPQAMLATLPQIIMDLQQRGFSFVRIDEMDLVEEVFRN